MGLRHQDAKGWLVAWSTAWRNTSMMIHERERRDDCWEAIGQKEVAGGVSAKCGRRGWVNTCVVWW